MARVAAAIFVALFGVAMAVAFFATLVTVVREMFRKRRKPKKNDDDDDDEFVDDLKWP